MPKLKLFNFDSLIVLTILLVKTFITCDCLVYFDLLK